MSSNAFIEEIKFNKEDLDLFIEETKSKNDKNREYLLEYPTVYIANHKEKHATQRRTFSNNEKRHVSEELIQNELNVLLTRGVNGLYIYAVDEQLRNKLLEVYRNKGE